MYSFNAPDKKYLPINNRVFHVGIRGLEVQP